MSVIHVPVLRDRVVEWLAPVAPGLLVDATVGLGGHAAALLEACPGFRLVGLDRDPEAIERARHRLQPFSDRVCLANRSFAHLANVLEQLGSPPPVEGFEEQLDALRTMGCDIVQGLLFGQPMTADEDCELLHTERDGTNSYQALFA